eukprot:COSAG06_NODE_2697_length_6436_cov_8.420546_3_plen_654_part_00
MDEGGAGEPSPAVLLDQLRRVGDLLSAPDGAPTLLYKALLAVLVFIPVFTLILGNDWENSTVDNFATKLAAGNTADGVVALSTQVAFLLAGPVALHTLRHATRHGGFLLALVGVRKTPIPQSRLDALQSTGRWMRCCGAALGLLAVALVVMVTGNSFGRMIQLLIFFMVFFPAVFLWWYSLKVAATLADVLVTEACHKARAQIEHLRESGGTMDVERWKSEVEEPVRRLGRETLLQLSNGWGLSVGLVSVGLVLLALSFLFRDMSAGLFLATTAVNPNDPIMGALVVVFGLTAGLVAVPFFLAMDPAAVSSKCARLEDDINTISNEDPGFTRAMVFVKSVQSLNKQQGLGFVVFGQVVTKRTLGLAASTIYAVAVAVSPTILAEAGLEPSCGAGGGQHGSCEFGWTFADGSCFKLFGDDALGTPLGWAEAEEECRLLGSHLASVTSAEQQAAVGRLAGGTNRVWIGLNDMAEEGSFVWSDGEPLEYSNWYHWDESQTGRDYCFSCGDGISITQMTHYQWNDHDQLDLLPYICAKKASPIAASGGEMDGCRGGRWVMGTPYKQVSALSYLPTTIVYGAYDDKVYDQIKPTKIALNETDVTTAAECATLVHRDHREATAAEYSNVGEKWCFAVFEAVGVIYDPQVQTCVFDTGMR